MVAKQPTKRAAKARTPKPDPVERARAEVAKGTTDAPVNVDPQLAVMVAEWCALRRFFDSPESPDEAQETTRWRGYVDLQRAIYAFPATTLADLCAKVPVLRDELQVLDECGPRDGEMGLDELALRGVLADLERLSGAAVGPTATVAETAAIEFEPIAEMARWTPLTDESLRGIGVALRSAATVLQEDKAGLIAMFADEGRHDSALLLLKVLDDHRDWLAGFSEIAGVAYHRLLVAAAAAVQADGEAA